MNVEPKSIERVDDVRRGANTQPIGDQVDAVMEQQFWMRAQSSSVNTVWGDGDEQLFSVTNYRDSSK